MTTEQKNSYLEAHMEVQQHMQQVSMQLNKHALNQPTHAQNHLNQHIIGGSHQSTSGLNIPNHYSNTIKV